jgi:iron complex outermembrane receptor protein
LDFIMTKHNFLATTFLAGFLAFSASSAMAADDAADSADAAADAAASDKKSTTAADEKDILIVANEQAGAIENSPATKVTLDAAKIAETVNAVNVEDAMKYMPSLIVRKRHVGDNFAPLATRTSGLGSSARSLIYADGASLSALIANNNGSGSPKWQLVAPEEISSIDVLYGPFSAAYPGNSIGTVVNMITRLPDRLEARASVLGNYQEFSYYGTVNKPLWTYQLSGSIGDRFGPLALFANATHTNSHSQPLAYVTAATAPTGSTGAFDDFNRTGTAIKVLGAGGLETHTQDNFKVKAALDISDGLRASYVLGVFLDDTTSTVQSFISNSTGAVYTTAFSSNIYKRNQVHLSHSLSFYGTGKSFDWQLIGTRYVYARDIQRTPTVAPPTAFTGGAGNSVRGEGTHWNTIDAKAAWKPSGDDSNILSFGGHYDRYVLASNRYGMTDWTTSTEGALNNASRGKTETVGLWIQDAYKLAPEVTLTVGGRYEWWRAFDGYNFSTSPALNVSQPGRKAKGFSPKASIEWDPAPGFVTRLSWGEAYRFPTVGELYQAITTGTSLSSPDPNLRPEFARSEELVFEYHGDSGMIRASLFNEVITDALISQTALLVTPTFSGSVSFIQNVEKTRARGLELAADWRNIVPDVDFNGSVTYTDAQTREDKAFPAAVGKILPSVPRWKATAVFTFHPTKKLSLTTAARMTSRNWGTLDNSDPVGNTYQGFYKYFVVDARATYKFTDQWEFALGVDNINNDKYFLFHPFPQRNVTAQISWKM